MRVAVYTAKRCGGIGRVARFACEDREEGCQGVGREGVGERERSIGGDEEGDQRFGIEGEGEMRFLMSWYGFWIMVMGCGEGGLEGRLRIRYNTMSSKARNISHTFTSLKI